MAPRAIALSPSLTRLVATATLVGLFPLVVGCGGPAPNAASHVLKTPELPADKQAKCHVAKSQSEPLIVEWPDAARGRLESISKRGLVAVHYQGCELEVLARCTVKSKGYTYSPITRKQSTVTIRDEDDLYAAMPVGAVKLEGKLKSAGQLNVAMTIVGRFESENPDVYRQDLEGDCSKATHVIAALSVGSFTFSAGSDAEVSGGASVAGIAGGGGRSLAARETIQRDGEEASCKVAGLTDKAPPEGCGALLQIEVMPFAKGAKSVAAAPIAPAMVSASRGSESGAGGLGSRGAEPNCPFGTRAEGGRCVEAPKRAPDPPPAPVDCPTGWHEQGTVCVRDSISRSYHETPSPQPAPMAPPPSHEDPTRPNPIRTLLGYGALGLGLVGASVGSLALTSARSAAQSCTASECADDYSDKRASAVRYGIAADIMLGLAAVSLVGFFLVPARVKIGAGPTSGGVAATAGGRF